MPEYRRPWIPGATYFITIITYRRRRLLASSNQVEHWRQALSEAKQRCGFTVIAGVILPDHLHLLLRLRAADPDISKPIGIAKAAFTRRVGTAHHSSSTSRRKHREADVWQRRFFDHAIRDEDDFAIRFDYLHYNPVKHGYVKCPGDWPYSSFDHWVKKGAYPSDWCCPKKVEPLPDFSAIEDTVGE